MMQNIVQHAMQHVLNFLVAILTPFQHNPGNKNLGELFAAGRSLLSAVWRESVRLLVAAALLTFMIYDRSKQDFDLGALQFPLFVLSQLVILSVVATYVRKFTIPADLAELLQIATKDSGQAGRNATLIFIGVCIYLSAIMYIGMQLWMGRPIG